MKLTGEFQYVCGKTGKAKASGKDWYQVTVLLKDPDEAVSIFTNREVFERLTRCVDRDLIYTGEFVARMWSNHLQISSLEDLVMG